MIILTFKEWFFTEGNKEDAIRLLNNDSNKYNTLINFLRNIPERNKSKHYIYLAYFFNDNPQNEINNVEELFNKNKISNIILKNNKPTIILPNGKEETTDNWLHFTEFVHALKDSDKPIYKTEEVDEEHLKPIFNKNNIKIYLADDVGQCVALGRGQKFCISQPGNTMYQSYRDKQISTFYFVYDNNKDQNNPLSLVVVDVTKDGMLLTDKNNKTGKISEYGKDSKKYLSYLYSKGVPSNLFKNKPKTQKEMDEDKKLGKQNQDFVWFSLLSRQEKSKYIGRGFVLSDKQFDLIFNDKVLAKQYVSNGLHNITQYQINKIKTNKDYFKTFVRSREIIVERTNKIKSIDIIINPKLIDEHNVNYNNILHDASENGHIDIVKLMLEKGAKDYNDAMVNASINGHIDIVKLMLEKDADHYNDAMKYASGNGHIDIVKLMLEKGADNYNIAMENASFMGRIDIVKLMLEKGANNYNDAMIRASLYGHIDIVKLMLEKGANDYNTAMEEASRNGHIDVVKLMLEKGANNYNEAMKYASVHGHIDVVKLMLEKGANDYNKAMASASDNGHINIVKLMLEKGANDYNTAMVNASINGHIDIVKLMLEKGANDYSWCIEASEGEYPEIANLIQSYKDKKVK